MSRPLISLAKIFTKKHERDYPLFRGAPRAPRAQKIRHPPQPLPQRSLVKHPRRFPLPHLALPPPVLPLAPNPNLTPLQIPTPPIPLHSPPPHSPHPLPIHRLPASHRKIHNFQQNRHLFVPKTKFQFKKKNSGRISPNPKSAGELQQ